MIEGTLVAVLGKLDSRVREQNKGDLVVGTFIGKISDKRVVVLLSDGNLFIGPEYEIAPVEEQTEDVSEEIKEE